MGLCVGFDRDRPRGRCIQHLWAFRDSPGLVLSASNPNLWVMVTYMLGPDGPRQEHRAPDRVHIIQSAYGYYLRRSC
jgi:hypothetical protein